MRHSKTTPQRFPSGLRVGSKLHADDVAASRGRSSPLALVGAVATFAFVASTSLVAVAQSPGSIERSQEIDANDGGFGGTLGAFASFGSAIGQIGDLDGDGIEDLVVGAEGDADGGPGTGAVWLLFMRRQGVVRDERKISASTLAGIDQGDLFGAAACGIGDHDGDGIPDVAVGAPFDDDGGLHRGAVWILFLDSDGQVHSQRKISDTAGGFTGDLRNEDFFGSSVAAPGDLDGDGIGDLVVGAYGDDDGAFAAGAVWVLFLESDGSVRTQTKISATSGGFGGALAIASQFGCSIASLGDLDGDGIGDLAVGARGDRDGSSGAGAVWILFMNTDGTVGTHQKISALEGGFQGDLETNDFLGWSIANAGDLDRDGVRDLAVGAPGDDDGDDDAGAIWFLFLAQDGTVHAQQKISATQGDFTGFLRSGDRFGRAVAAIGDLDADTIGDIAVGSLDDGDAQDQGAVWVLFPEVGPCGDASAGTVDQSNGFPFDSLLVDGSAGIPTRSLDAQVGDTVQIEMRAAPRGPAPGRFALWVWLGTPDASDAAALVDPGSRMTVGCTVFPISLQGGLPQPVRCVTSPGLPLLGGCSTPPIFPTFVPWNFPKPLPRPITLTLQGLVEDASSPNPRRFSVTNAIRLDAR